MIIVAGIIMITLSHLLNQQTNKYTVAAERPRGEHDRVPVIMCSLLHSLYTSKERESARESALCIIHVTREG